MHALSLLCAVLASASPQAPNLSEDARLAAPVSARLKIAALPETVLALEKASGVKLKVAPAIADLKCILLVEGKPAHLVMEKLADDLRCTWTKDGDGYTLSMSSQETVKEKEYVATADRLKRERAERQVQAYAWAGGISSADRKSTMGQIERELQELYKKPFAEVGAERTRLEERRMALSQTEIASKYVVAYLYRSLTPEALKAFWAGEPLVGSVDETPGAAEVQRSNRYPPPTGEDPNLRYVIERYSPVTYAITNYTLSFERATGKSAGAGRGGTVQVTGYDSIVMASLALTKDCVAWAALPKDAAALDAGIEVRVPAKESRYPSGYFSDADHLEWLFDQTKIPIVGSAYRLANRSSNLERPGTVRGYLQKFAKDTEGYVRFSDGFISYRRGGFPMYRRLEISEAVLRPMEQKSSLNLNDYAALAQKLTPYQAEAIQLEFTYLTEFSLSPITGALPALQFYSALSSTQRSNALAGRPQEVRGLTTAQQKQFLGTLWQGLFQFGDVGFPTFQAILKGDTAAFADNVFVIETKDVFLGKPGKAMPLDWFDTHNSYSGDSNSETVTGIRLRFGPRRGGGVSYVTYLGK